MYPEHVPHACNKKHYVCNVKSPSFTLKMFGGDYCNFRLLMSLFACASTCLAKREKAEHRYYPCMILSKRIQLPPFQERRKTWTHWVLAQQRIKQIVSVEHASSRLNLNAILSLPNLHSSFWIPTSFFFTLLFPFWSTATRCGVVFLFDYRINFLGSTRGLISSIALWCSHWQHTVNFSILNSGNDEVYPWIRIAYAPFNRFASPFQFLSASFCWSYHPPLFFTLSCEMRPIFLTYTTCFLFTWRQVLHIPVL